MTITSMIDRDALRQRLIEAVNVDNEIDAISLADGVFDVFTNAMQPVLNRSIIEIELMFGDVRLEIGRLIGEATDGAVYLDWALNDVIDEIDSNQTEKKS